MTPLLSGNIIGEESTLNHDLSNCSSGIHQIIRSMNLNENEYDVNIHDGTITLKLENKNNIDSHFQIIQNIISYLYMQQLTGNIATPNSSVGEFVVTPVDNQNIPQMHFSLNSFMGEESESDSDDENMNHIYIDEDDKYDYFANCKLINKYLGKPEKIKKSDPLIVEECDCYICFEKYKEHEYKRKLPKCGHTFHKKCVDKWLKTKSTCPHCRCDLMEDVKMEVDDIDYYEKDEMTTSGHEGVEFTGVIEFEFGVISLLSGNIQSGNIFSGNIL